MHQSLLFWIILVKSLPKFIVSVFSFFFFFHFKALLCVLIYCFYWLINFNLMCTVLGVIMEYRRRQKGDYYNSRDPSRRRSLKKKPPRCMWKFLIYSNCQIVWFFFFFNNNFPNLMYDRLFFPFFENCFLIMSFVLFFSSMIWVAVALMNWKQIVLISMHVLKPNIS